MSSRDTIIETESCPFCGGKATILRMRNGDELHVKHKENCFIKSAAICRYHWGDSERIPAEPFADWCQRVPRKS